MLSNVTSQQDGLGFKSAGHLEFFCVEFAWSGFPPYFFSVAICIYVCVCPVMDWWPVHGVPCFLQNAWWDRLRFPVTLDRISSIEIGWMDGYLLMHNYICPVSTLSENQQCLSVFWGTNVIWQGGRLAAHCKTSWLYCVKFNSKFPTQCSWTYTLLVNTLFISKCFFGQNG